MLQGPPLKEGGVPEPFTFYLLKHTSDKEISIPQMRRAVRPYFVDTSWKAVYDVITWLFTHIAVYYLMSGFIVLHLSDTIRFYQWVLPFFQDQKQHFYIIKPLYMTWQCCYLAWTYILTPAMTRQLDYFANLPLIMVNALPICLKLYRRLPTFPWQIYESVLA